MNRHCILFQIEDVDDRRQCSHGDSWVAACVATWLTSFLLIWWRYYRNVLSRWCSSCKRPSYTHYRSVEYEWHRSSSRSRCGHLPMPTVNAWSPGNLTPGSCSRTFFVDSTEQVHYLYTKTRVSADRVVLVVGNPRSLTLRKFARELTAWTYRHTSKATPRQQMCKGHCRQALRSGLPGHDQGSTAERNFARQAHGDHPLSWGGKETLSIHGK